MRRSCWLTVQYPPQVDAAPETGVYAPRGHERQLAKGDGVVFYERKGKPGTRFRWPEEGSSKTRQYLHEGRGAVVRVGIVEEVFTPPRVSSYEEAEGASKEWLRLGRVRLLTTTDSLSLSHAELYRILGYSANAPLLGHGGIRPIPEEAFRRIAEGMGIEPGSLGK